MLRYVLRRGLSLIPVLLGVSVLVFAMLHLAPGDPVELILNQSGEQTAIPPEVYAAVAHKYGFDKPLVVQYWSYVSAAARGDLGNSIIEGRPVAQMIGEEWPYTVRLAVAALIFAVVLGVGLGILAALNRGGWWDTASMLIASFGVAMPSFWFGLLAILIFAVFFGVLPASGVGGLRYLALPAVTLGIGSAASIARLTRSTLVEVLTDDYIRTARAKGLAEARIVAVHAMRNALIPVVTLVGLQFGALLSGAIVVETVFARRGIGSLVLEAVTSKDFPLAQGLVLTIAVVYVVVNLGVDLLYAYLDPRIRYS